MVLAVDFDGTLVTNNYPKIGEPNIPLIEKLIRKQKEDGVELILWTCRNGVLLEEAVTFCLSYGLQFNYVNSNAHSKLVEYHWDDTRKVGADYYIDDRMISIKDFLESC